MDKKCNKNQLQYAISPFAFAKSEKKLHFSFQIKSQSQTIIMASTLRDIYILT